MAWNFGDILDAISPVIPGDAPALIHGNRTITWAQTTQRSNNLARALIAGGARPGDKVAFYMRNRSEYVEALAACFKARLTHVNVNYRYRPDEVFYIFDNSDAQAVIYGSEFRETIAEIRPRLNKVGTFVEVSETEEVAPFAMRYETLATTGDGTRIDIARSPDDEFFIYTGGTTGMPKGVIWTHDALRETQLIALRRLGPAPETMPALIAAVKAVETRPRTLPACPLMHGTGLLMALSTMMNGGCVITLQAHSFDAREFWEVTERTKAGTLVIVGDAFARPMLQALRETPRAYDLSSVTGIISSGVMWTRENKHALIEYMPQAQMLDSFGSSEAVGFGSSITTKDGEVDTAKFLIGDRCKVFDENDVEIMPGSGKPGIIAMCPPIPKGYYKDAEKTAKTFKTINGARYVMPGDWCVVEADGTLTLLGRGSACINTAGEKVYPEEVEESLKTHPTVEDALVVGLPDEKWGQAVTAVVTLRSGAAFDEAALRHHVHERLAAYKAPKHVMVSGVVLRAPNGKADYKSALTFAKQALRID